MEKNVPQPSHSDDASAPLTFTLQQAAALCGIAAHQLCEWTDCGYVSAAGNGDRRRYNRDALRQILRVRDALRAGRRPRLSIRHRDPSTDTPNSGIPPEEECEALVLTDRQRMSVQVALYYALNPNASLSVDQLAERLDVEATPLAAALDAMVASGDIARGRRDGAPVYQSGRARLHGPSPRELRVRATHRSRCPSQPE